MERYDCVVVGAGPGGSIFARNAAQKGFKTLIIEKETLPRYKSCGGGLTHAIKKIVDFDYSEMIERSPTGVAFISRDEDGILDYPNSMPVDMISRQKFDHYLVKQALTAGSELLENTKVISVVESKDRVTLKTRGGDAIEALLVIGADGALSVVARAAGLDKRKGGIAIEAEIYPRDPGALEEHGSRTIFGFGFLKNGYGWIFPKKDHFSVGIGTGMERMPGLLSLYKQFTDRFDFLKGEKEDERRGWFIPYSRGSQTINTRRICLVGDSGYLVDPFSGEGIYPAILSGMIASEIACDEIMKKGRLSRKYSREIKKSITGDYFYAWLCSEIFYARPSFFYRKRRVIDALTRLSKKEIRYRDVLNELRKR